MYCIKCGAEMKDGTNFCPKCGAPVNANPNGSNPAPPAGGMPEAPFPTIPVPVETPDGMEMPYNTGMPSGMGMPDPAGEQNDDKKGKGMIILLALLCLLLIGGVGGGIFYFTGHFEKEEEDSFEGTGGHSVRSEISERDLDEETEESDVEEEEPAAEEAEEVLPVYEGERTPINLNIHQVDNSNFPEVVFYASIVDEDNNVVENLDRTDFKVQEIDIHGNVTDVTINDVYKVLNQDTISVNLVLDASGSMTSGNKMQQAKNAATALVSQMELGRGDQVEVISFDDYVYLNQNFTGQQDLLYDAIDSIYPMGATALYDALYAGLYQTYFESGVKCVIGFTDGMENCSSYTFDDVVTLAQNSSIPVFIIGIGEEYDADALRWLAEECSGAYYSANVSDLESILTDIYLSIYEQQQDYYVFKYTASDTGNQNEFRDIVLTTSESTEFIGTYTKEYVPQSDISGAFNSSYMDMDFMLDFSSQREVTDADLAGLSLAQLRIARNEIFARHGRQFKDSMLNQWFYSKTWYLDIQPKYSPDDFDKISPSPLTKLEIQNVDFIVKYENNIMNSSDIYPDASIVLLSDYDLALSKAVLRTALSQVQEYPDTDILKQNKERIQQAIDKEDVQY